jgi:DNA/RNA endonuclease G (NUC1)
MHLRRMLPVLAICLAISVPVFATSNLVISQVYGGGGNAGATLKNDFIELFNRGTSTVNLTGWSVQYTSSAGTTWQSTNLSGSLAPGKYYLVQEAAGAGGTVNLPTPDATGNINMSATGAKVALVNSTTLLSGSCPAAADFFGYDGANCFEGTATAPLTNTTAAIRNSGGCTDTDNNSADFTIATPAPRNSVAPANSCTVTNNPPSINAPANPAATVLQNAPPFSISLSGTDDNNIFNWSATPGTGVSTVTVASGQSTANITYTVTLASNFTGTASFTASLSDTVNAAVTRQVNILVNAVTVNNPPTITPPNNPITTVEANAPAFTVSLTGSDDGGIYNWSATPGAGMSLVSVTGGQGTTTATFTLTLQGGFSGPASFTAFLSDNVNAAASQTANITVTSPPPPPDHLVISQVYGGGGNSGATYQNDYVEIYNPTTSPVDVAGWTLQYFSAASTGISTNIQPLGGVIGPGEYFLVALASGGAVGAPLPAANISGGINMSATAGKIALASNGDPLLGPSGCPVGSDPDLVDFVGYGTTANCREGSTNAPAASNTTALFRKNSGLTDTNVNGSDFIVGAPNPRRTTPIQEIGPFVVTTDPVSSATTAPRDSSITVTFSEPVNVVGQWYDITCASTGAHNDATFAVTDGGSTQVITPNVSFLPGEQCTVTIFKDTVHDQDLDDSAPNTDTLPANRVWSFTVATGAAPPYTSDVHLTMGNPSGAIADVNFPNNYLMMKPAYALSYNRDKGTPNWVSWHLTNEWYGTLTRVDTFRPDPAVPPSWYRVQAFDFFATGFDRGHMTPNADRDNENRVPVNQETYLMSNMVPQAPDNNQGPWANMENALRTIADAGNELYIVSGPAGVGGTGSNGGVTTTLAGGHVTVPAYTWKVALVLSRLDGNDVARVTASTRTIAVIMPNTQGIRTNNSNDWQGYLTTVDAVETLTGYDFFSNVPLLEQNCIEAGVNGDNPPCVANQSLSTNEDTAGTITLNALSPTNGAFTYTLGTPAHGMLSGTGANRTYTPAPDFNGSDSFTFSVNDGHANSNTGTVTITVLEVNDPPVATADSKSTDEDTAVMFAASDLTANDSPGPANESGQTLTVTSASSTADTHGSVVLANGQVTYTPDGNFNGAASFTYQVCDNGVTVGMLHALCAEGIVNVMVRAVNDPPTAAADSKSTNEDTVLIFAASDLTANDSPGPADEIGQTLTVTNVSSTSDTHGSVALANGQITHTPAANFNGVASFTYQVCDNGAPPQCATGTVNLTIVPVNDPPVAGADSAATEAGSAVTLPAANLVTNDFTGPADEAGQTLTVTAVTATPDTHGTVAFANGQVTYTPAMFFTGPATFTYSVCDDGTPSQCATGIVTVTVTDTTAPLMSALTLSETRLWPPNHQMVPISVTYTVSDLGDPAPACALSVSSNEPINGQGDGDTSPDWLIVDSHHVQVRAERAGGGNGRIYTIAADCRDRFGNASQKSATVTVPKNNSGK